jgi:hypothetical protein
MMLDEIIGQTEDVSLSSLSSSLWTKVAGE